MWSKDIIFKCYYYHPLRQTEIFLCLLCLDRVHIFSPYKWNKVKFYMSYPFSITNLQSVFLVEYVLSKWLLVNRWHQKSVENLVQTFNKDFERYFLNLYRLYIVLAGLSSTPWKENLHKNIIQPQPSTFHFCEEDHGRALKEDCWIWKSG